jgi:hypothetical protein
MKSSKPCWLLSAVLLFTTCGQRSQRPDASDAASPTFQNVLILLDLSDRITLDGQLDKDQEIIKAALDVFQDNQRKFGFINSKDMLRLAIAPEPGVTAIANNRLIIDMNTMVKGRNAAASKGKPAFDEIRQEFEAELASLYAKASENLNTGADIYTFFCTTLPVSFLGYPDKITKVIVLTDGYLYFNKAYQRKRPKGSFMIDTEIARQRKSDDPKGYYKKKKLALKACNRSLDNVEVLFLEIAPKFQGESVNEFDIVSHYWSEWFSAMGVEAQMYPQNHQVSNIKGYIKNFLKRD